jgi:hypothetical protein
MTATDATSLAQETAESHQRVADGISSRLRAEADPPNRRSNSAVEQYTHGMPNESAPLYGVQGRQAAVNCMQAVVIRLDR